MSSGAIVQAKDPSGIDFLAPTPPARRLLDAISTYSAR